ncbi:hypothetical protein AMTR_s00086p00131210 [Amborella trichopoda]|uniref:Uncharacterized protein n=1 Tax=Amborella trichopoda TaxID=13333 RepID=W1NYZ0_AMBTC|nr:hypothetical protein AMTR_s00086p00131210 [Amborella trichopoda]
MVYENKILMKIVASKSLKSPKKTNTPEPSHYPLIDYNLEDEENAEPLMSDKSETCVGMEMSFSNVWKK